MEAKIINIKDSDFTRVNNDINGNPRFVLHFLSLTPGYDNGSHDKFKELVKARYDNNLFNDYNYILYLNKKLSLGGRKFHNKQYGGGLVFQSYNLGKTIEYIERQLNNFYNENLK